jgi:hypothetical protein
MRQFPSESVAHRKIALPRVFFALNFFSPREVNVIDMTQNPDFPDLSAVGQSGEEVGSLKCFKLTNDSSGQIRDSRRIQSVNKDSLA